MLRAKWLEELEQEKYLGISTRFKEWYIKGCYDAVMTRYFLTDRLYIFIQLYRKWYKQQHNNKWEDFYMWLDERVIPDQAIMEKRMSHIKGALIITFYNLEEQLEDWREGQ